MRLVWNQGWRVKLQKSNTKVDLLVDTGAFITCLNIKHLSDMLGLPVDLLSTKLKNSNLKSSTFYDINKKPVVLYGFTLYDILLGDESFDYLNVFVSLNVKFTSVLGCDFLRSGYLTLQQDSHDYYHTFDKDKYDRIWSSIQLNDLNALCSYD